jgi:hypothetical protein
MAVMAKIRKVKNPEKFINWSRIETVLCWL